MGKPKHSLEFRIAVINYYLSGQGGTTRTAAHFSIHKSTVSHWVASWKMHGIDGITWKNERYSPEFKLNVVLALRNDSLSFREAAVRFNISDNKVVKRWLDIYETSGENGLSQKRQKSINTVKKTKQIPRSPDTAAKSAEMLSHDELLAEVRYLRAEVDYLKKLKALAQQKKNPG